LVWILLFLDFRAIIRFDRAIIARLGTINHVLRAIIDFFRAIIAMTGENNFSSYFSGLFFARKSSKLTIKCKKIIKAMQVFFVGGQYNSRPVQLVLQNLQMKGAFTHEEKAINVNRWLIAIGYVPCWLCE
jgi:hypothetical protein